MVSQSFARWVFTALLSSTTVWAASHIVHEKRDSVPAGFTLLSPAPAEQTLNMRINLAMSDQAGLQAALDQASSPTSATFREWLTKEQVRYALYLACGA